MLSWFKGKRACLPDIMPHVQENAVCSVRSDARQFRAIAKIGFHYLLATSDLFGGDEDCFAGIRQFIMQGGDIESFVTWNQKPILHDSQVGYQPKLWGHILVGEVDAQRIIVRMQFFLGPGSMPPTYEVHLGPNLLRLTYPTASAWGHWFSYYDQPLENGSIGEVKKIHAINKTRPPWM